MNIEVIGSASSGKTTIIAGIMESFRDDSQRCSLVSVGGNYYYDFISLPWFIKFAVKNKELCMLARRSIFKNVTNRLGRLNLQRNFIKKMGTSELFSRRSQERNSVILWDEGPVHAAHNLFVHMCNEPVLSDVEAFAKHVPIPDLILYIRTPLNEVLYRMKQRGGHKRSGQNDKDMNMFCKHAREVFDKLVSINRIRNRTIIIENNNNNQKVAIAKALKAISKGRSDNRFKNEGMVIK